MSVYIKGMEMPTSCGECKFFAWKRGVGQHCAVDDRITFHATIDGMDVAYERSGACPLIPISDHGRLIDADALCDGLVSNHRGGRVMGGYYWYSDNPNCGRCGHLNSRGFCNMTACIYPVLPQTTVIQKKRTNADRVRSMTDEELADFLCDIGECDRRCPAKIGDCIFSDSTCRGAWLDWLKQEAE